MEDELAIFGLGNLIYLETAEAASAHQWQQEIFRRYAEAGLEEIKYNDDRLFAVRGKYRGRNIGFYGIPFGLSYLGRMDDVMNSPAVKAVGGTGFCGSVRHDIEKDTMIVATEAVMSPYAVYDAEWNKKLAVAKADAKLVEAMLKNARKRGYSTRTGKIFTVLNTRCETSNFIRQLSENSYDAVEMETAAVYQIANKIKKPAAVILYVSDNQATELGLDIVGTRIRELEKQGKHIEMAEIARDALLETY